MQRAQMILTKVKQANFLHAYASKDHIRGCYRKAIEYYTKC